MIISGLFWLVLIIFLNEFYKINIAKFERNVGSLKIGMSETEITSILGKPQYIKRVTYFRPTDEAVPPHGKYRGVCLLKKIPAGA